MGRYKRSDGSVQEGSLYPYIFLFTISFVSNALPFGGAPYTLIGAFYAEKLGLVNVILITALGAASAKVVLYATGLGSRRLMERNKNYAFFERIVRKRSFLVALFITAIIPGLPLDDFLYLWGGSVKGDLLKMLAVTFAAKLLKSGVEIPLELRALSFASDLTGVNLLSNVYFQIGSVVFFIVIGVILFVIDWEKTLNWAKEKITWPLKSSRRRSFQSM